ncbi:hypothetical protein HN419_03070 [Candidatus Woesearchaeota archaeon]|jgi:hypothetical protein|nr:hypothetical protein [Candidatus Woesearchaeota archaeon]MBT3537021.1 hypothetical protein [Candidatus Woesearchaeota archaeon]MBT4697631.1 hypothetical protein [Candidatus Woesearchaeota archaeon]MBT7106669.1 hypothetical protein [Candidatus Woesearchaeota archaeon]MBT7931767.1 hypothetical protein [Candidatus Woesearchaeota archaeon]
MGRVNIEITDELHKKLKIACITNEKTIEKFINEAVKEKLKR